MKVIKQPTIKIIITKDETDIKFYNNSFRKQYYGSTLFSGEVIELIEIIKVENEEVYFKFLDEEICSVPVDSFKFIEVKENYYE